MDGIGSLGIYTSQVRKAANKQCLKKLNTDEPTVMPNEIIILIGLTGVCMTFACISDMRSWLDYTHKLWIFIGAPFFVRGERKNKFD